MLLDSDVCDLHDSTKTVPEKSRTRCVELESNEKELGKGISLMASREFSFMSREEIPHFLMSVPLIPKNCWNFFTFTSKLMFMAIIKFKVQIPHVSEFHRFRQKQSFADDS